MAIANGRTARKDVTERIELLKQKQAENDRLAAEQCAQERIAASSR
jgi:hypothetical protein